MCCIFTTFNEQAQEPSMNTERISKITIPNFHVVIVAAGCGLRFDKNSPKQYQCLLEKSVLRYSIEAFLKLETLQSLRVVINAQHEHFYSEAIQGLDLAPFVLGGAERSDSVYNALKSLSGLKDDEIVLIHDAARPLICMSDIAALLIAMNEHDAATLAVPVVDTLKYSNSEQNSVERHGLWAIQTPQAFRYGVIKKAHEQAKTGKCYTDDTGLVVDCGVPVHFVKGSKRNFKITEKEDMAFAENILSANLLTEHRTGTGYDVHRFDDSSRDVHTLKLCGVGIPHFKNLKGHSDADVGLHALTDALLGAIGEGDIGLLFPPSDPAFKDMDSAVFLQKARDLVLVKGAKIVNVDVTLICEVPKIGPYRQSIVKRVAEILDITPDRVNVKATTTEGLGFTGREEGVAAQAIATVCFSTKSGDV